MFIIRGLAKRRKRLCGGVGTLSLCSLEGWEDSSTKQADFLYF